MNKHDIEIRILELERMLLTARGAWREMIGDSILGYKEMLVSL